MVDLFNACSDDVVVCFHRPSLLVVDGGGGPDHHQVGGEDVSSFVRCTHEMDNRFKLPANSVAKQIFNAEVSDVNED